MTPAKTRSPADVLPLRPVDFLVLLMLGRGERHGYGIMQDVLAHTDGRTELRNSRARISGTHTSQTRRCWNPRFVGRCGHV